jgi:hypothetical protein
MEASMSTDYLPLGHVMMCEGKPYTIVRVEPYVRKLDGAETMVYHFDGVCRHPDCDTPVSASLGAFSLGKTLVGSACPKHKGWTGPEGLARRRAGKAASRAGKSA